MNLFDKTVQAALEYNKSYGTLRPVVEKEIMHRDILREMNKAGYLKKLTFIGGTCLRLCYGSERLSEDLDFSSEFNFKKEDLSALGEILRKAFLNKYGFKTEISAPQKETGNTDTWKIKIFTRGKQKHLPAQRINIDITRIPSYNRRPVMLKDYYGLELGISGLIMFAEDMEEIFADKIIAFANRPNRIKNRDLWDIFWLERKNINLDKTLLNKKLKDRKIKYCDFLNKFNVRLRELNGGQKDFMGEMRRFLAPSAFDETFTSALWWEQFLSMLRSLFLFKIK